MLSNAYFLAKFRFDTAENEPAKNLQKFCKFAMRSPSDLHDPLHFLEVRPAPAAGRRAPSAARPAARRGTAPAGPAEPEPREMC